MFPKLWSKPDTTTPRVQRIINIVGRPKRLESEVNEYLSKGYDLGSSILPYNDPDMGQGMFIQQVILYQEELENVTDTTT